MAALIGIEREQGEATTPSCDDAYRRGLMAERNGAVRRIGSEADLRLH
jgi:hypothetical protein